MLRLIVDELGYLLLEPKAAHLFPQLVSRRYKTDAMLITSNRSVAEWAPCSPVPRSPPRPRLALAPEPRADDPRG